MKRKIGLLVVFLLFVCVAFAQAMPIYSVQTTSGRIGNGGPFLVNSSFETFCIETGEYLNLPGTYYGSIDSGVMYSTGGGLTYVDVNTAKLYSYFLDNAGLSEANERLIQLAIWDFQDQVGYDGTQAANPFYIAASGYALTHNVMALNLWTADIQSERTKVQSLLTVVPEPSILMLLGLGLVGIAGLRRKM